MKENYKFSVITIFPELFEPFCSVGVFGRAVKNAILNIETINPRDFTNDLYNSVDDVPYGGGAGMVFKPLPLYKSIKKAKKNNKGKVIFLSPAGKKFTSEKSKQFAAEGELILLCGRYEGIDQRIIDLLVDEELSIGDYVLSGGEQAAICVMDSIARHIKGVVKEEASVINDSFYNGLLDHPHYTRPEIFNKMKVPDVLLSGNHKKIDLWRQKMQIVETLTKRPDLIEEVELSKEQKKIIREIQWELRKHL